MAAKTRKRSRRPGRPPATAELDTRQALLEAARELFAEHDFDEVSGKRIADAAGVNPAMIQYHFGSKAGLLETAFHTTVAPVIDELTALSAGRAQTHELQQVFAVYMRTMAANPWLPKILIRHVLPDGGRLQALLIERLRRDVGPAIRALLQRGLATGELREDLDPTLATVSLIGLALFPFISLPVTRRVLGFDVDSANVGRLIDHTVALFYDGAGGRNRASA